MPRNPTFTVESRESGQRWHVQHRGEAESIACAVARRLARETWPLKTIGGGSIPRYPDIGVRRGSEVILVIGPRDRREV
jgi:hypothetical protein